MRIGISASKYNLDGAIKKCIECGFNHLEIGLDDISDWDTIRKYNHKFKSNDISIGIHMPLEINPCERTDFVRKSWFDFLWISMNIGKAFDVKYYNMHMGYGISSFIKSNRSLYMQNCTSFLEGIDSSVGNSFLCVENMYESDGYISNLGTKKEDFEYVLGNSPNTQFCFDTGHNLISPDDYLESFSPKIKVVHISGNDGKKDLHEGIVDNDLLDYSFIKRLIRLKSLEYTVLEMKDEFLYESHRKIMDIIMD